MRGDLALHNYAKNKAHIQKSNQKLGGLAESNAFSKKSMHRGGTFIAGDREMLRQSIIVECVMVSPRTNIRNPMKCILTGMLGHLFCRYRGNMILWIGCSAHALFPEIAVSMTSRCEDA